jgi:hypothetical protein
MPENRASKHAVIYFEQGAQAAMKDLAGQIRGEGGKTTLIWAKMWKGAENMIPEARAVIIQKGCAFEEKIVEAYRKYGVDVEIHFVNEDGIGIDVAEEEAEYVADEETNPDAVPEEAVEAAADPEEADAEAVEAADDEPEDDARADRLSDAEGTDSGVDEKGRVED